MIEISSGDESPLKKLRPTTADHAKEESIVSAHSDVESNVTLPDIDEILTKYDDSVDLDARAPKYDDLVDLDAYVPRYKDPVDLDAYAPKYDESVDLDAGVPKYDDSVNLGDRTEADQLSTVSEFSTYYDNDRLLPVYKSMNKGIKTSEVVALLTRDLPNEHLAKNIPVQITRDTSFVYSISHIGHWKNALCDGMGKWTQNGTDKTINVAADGSIIDVIRRTYINGSACTLHRIVIQIENKSTGELFDNMFVQYYFSENESTHIEIKPHGNAKFGKTPYQRTSQTTKDKIKNLCRTHPSPKDVFHIVLEETGGLENVANGSQLARDRMQISNFKRTVRETVNDPVLECADLAKEQEKDNNRFLRKVGASPEYFMFMASDQQLHDIEKFCTDNKNFSVLGVDTTFNIGKYYLTVTTYRNLMLETPEGVEPVMIGPLLLHQRKTYESYFNLPSSMVQACPNIKNVRVFGTDGDANLYTCFHDCFLSARHLLCDIHMMDNIKNKLKTLNITGQVADEFIKDIFGKQVGQTKIKGLVDCTSPEMYDVKFHELQNKWKNRHSNGQIFTDYFIKNKCNLIKECMLADVRSMCGMGFPPQTYNQNANECINHVIKSETRGKKNSDVNPYELVKLLHNIVKRQESEVKLSILGKGQYRLKKEYSYLHVPEATFYRKSSFQRAAVFKRQV